ncbi:aldehyde ferredoxin oxidoreductase family protein [Candidatus Poribacteria bacterium]|nr:aldehyde ferredoxin oxidoreductase family protein [Candidatus Poribacteria bacterium]
MGYGYWGKVLRIDLSSGRIEVETPDPIIYRRYLGGSAFGLHYLLKELKPGIDPLSPQNMLIFTSSVLGGTPLPGATRLSVLGKSPLTGGLGETEAGGWFAPELKRAGFDAIIIRGRSDRPVYLWIKDGKAEIRDASHLWGKLTGEVSDILKEELGDNRVRIAQIGPGGEKLVRYAGIVNELHHFNGRTGMGAVMGSKNLRAIAVRGTQEVPMYDPEKAREIVRWFVREYYKPQPGDMHDLGTSRIVKPLSDTGILPTRNFREGSFEGAEQISGERMRDTILIRRGTCYACPIACKRVVKVDEGPFKVDPKYGGPEYETVASMGSLCGVSDLRAIAKANEICSKYAVDTISCGVSIAFAMECYENGILTKEDTGGLDLRFGNAEALVKMVEMICRREGLGDILAEGVKRAAEKIGKGAERFAMHVKGQEVPMHEPRGKKSLALAYSTSPTGADHMEAPHDPALENLGPEAGDPLEPLGLIEPMPSLEFTPRKVKAYYYCQILWNLYNCIDMCDFVGVPLGPFPINKLVEYTRAVTGWDTSLWELMKVGERAATMARIFNFREGFTREDDTLPERLFQGLEGGTLKGEKIDKEKFEELLELFYQMYGWDPKTGFPTRGKLAELDLLWAVE